MVNLDELSIYREYDPQGMLDRIHEFPAECLRAWQQSMRFDLPPDYRRVSNVIILGMGGSAIGGDLAASLAYPEARIPILVCRDYHLPAFADDKSLVIASSYSGMTEETLSAFAEALKRGARKLVITTGGKLKDVAERANVPVFRFDYPAQPRAALPYSLLPILCFLQKLGIVGDKTRDLEEAVRVLEALADRLKETVKLSENPAKRLASGTYGKLPVIYGSGILSEVAHRWKTQLNENSKAWAFYEVFPELNHNAVVGYQFPPEVAGKTIVVFLHSSLLEKRVQLRYRVTRELLEKAGVAGEVLEGEGESPLSHMLSLILFGDYTSFYLALLYKTDPSPVKTIDYLKSRLTQEA